MIYVHLINLNGNQGRGRELEIVPLVESLECRQGLQLTLSKNREAFLAFEDCIEVKEEILKLFL